MTEINTRIGSYVQFVLVVRFAVRWLAAQGALSNNGVLATYSKGQIAASQHIYNSFIRKLVVLGHECGHISVLF